MRIRQILSEATLGLRRNLVMSTAAVLTIAVSLTFVGGALLVSQTVDRLQAAFNADIEVLVYLDRDVSDPERTGIQRILAGLPLVERVTYESKADAYERFLRQNPNDPDLTENVTPDVLPESYAVKLTDPQQYAIVASASEGLPGVDQVVDNRDLVDDLFRSLNGLRDFAYATAVIQVIAATLLIANTVRLTAFSRRREIGVMRLVGANRTYIQLPFLLEGLVVGLLGTALAGGLLAAGKVFLVDGRLEGLYRGGNLQPPSWGDIYLVQGPLLLAVGLLVSLLASFVTLQRYVRV